MFGYSSSPLLYDGRLYIQAIRNKRQNRYGQGPEGNVESYLLAIDPATGKDLWKQDRLTDAREEALEAYSRSLELNPDNTPVLFKMGELAQGLGRHDEALEAYDRALRLDPENAPVMNNRGTVLSHMARREEALAAYDEALPICRQLADREPEAFRPDLAMTLNNRGAVLSALGRREEALAALDEALDLLRPFYQREPDAFRERWEMVQSNRQRLKATE
jgi:tetratricopeptide (TPR) repeat protein